MRGGVRGPLRLQTILGVRIVWTAKINCKGHTKKKVRKCHPSKSANSQRNVVARPSGKVRTGGKVLWLRGAETRWGSSFWSCKMITKQEEKDISSVPLKKVSKEGK